MSLVAYMRPVAKPMALVTGVGVSAALLGGTLDHHLFGASSAELVKWTLLLQGLAAGFMVTAGVLRLAKWQLQHDAHSALVGSALVVMGAICLPLGGLARWLVPHSSGAMLSAAVHAFATFLALSLILRALDATEVAERDRPALLLFRIGSLVAAVFLGVLVLGLLRPEAGGESLAHGVLAAAVSLGWLYTTLRAIHACPARPWAGRAAPLYAGMALAEGLRGVDLGQFGVWHFAGGLMYVSVAAVAARCALIDHEQAVRADAEERSYLSAALDRASSRADEVSVWREQLTHDVCNSVAGLRAAMSVLQGHDRPTDPLTAEQLCGAAVDEIGHLQHLLTRTPNHPLEVFEVGELVHRISAGASALGMSVSVQATDAAALARPDDLAAVLRHLLVNSRMHAPKSTVSIRVTSGRDLVTVTYSDDGPGLSGDDGSHVFERHYRGAASPGSGLGLYAARQLMREQGGDLSIGHPCLGATFVISLVAVTAPVGQPMTRSAHPWPGAEVEVPTPSTQQRDDPPSSSLVEPHGRSA